jgi:hypothetical protein
VEHGHVVVRCEEMHRSLGYLHIGIGIPWQDLAGRGCLLAGAADEDAIPKLTLRFHHQPRSVPCMSHVSTPISAKVAR